MTSLPPQVDSLSFHLVQKVPVRSLNTVRRLFRQNWNRNQKVRLLGSRRAGLSGQAGQGNLLTASADEKWSRVLAAADGLRERFGFSSVQLATALPPARRKSNRARSAGRYRARTIPMTIRQRGASRQNAASDLGSRRSRWLVPAGAWLPSLFRRRMRAGPAAGSGAKRLRRSHRRPAR